MYISYKNVRYTFDKSAEKIDGRALVPSPMLRLAISSASLNNFFWNSPRQPFRCKGQAARSFDEENCFVKEGDRVTRQSTTSGTGSLRLVPRGSSALLK